jgi:hypothetical protein
MPRRLRSFLVVTFLAVLLVPSVCLADPNYETGTLVDIEKKVKITPLSYVFEVVASYYETVTYVLQIRVGDQIYFTDYTPDVQPNGPLPSEWKPDQTIQFRTEKHHLFVKLSYDREIETFIARREHQKP